MGDKIKKQAKVKEPIRIRYKALNNGNQSIYLDFYYDGRREYEFLKLYLVPETSAANREANKETLKLANAIKAQKIVELQNNAHGFSIGGQRGKANLVEYIEAIAEKKREQAGGSARGSYQFYMALAYHIRKYSGDKTIFRHVDRELLSGVCGIHKVGEKQVERTAFGRQYPTAVYTETVVGTLHGHRRRYHYGQSVFADQAG